MDELDLGSYILCYALLSNLFVRNRAVNAASISTSPCSKYQEQKKVFTFPADRAGTDSLVPFYKEN